MTKKLSEIAFFTDKVAEMTDFYRRFLDQEPDSAWPGGAIFMLGDVKLFIHEQYTPEDAGDLPPFDHLAFTVKDVDQTAGELSEVEIHVDRPPADYYWGRSAYVRDPAGHFIEITAGD